MSTPIITERSIRTFLMDRRELNPLLQGVRWDSNDIEEAVITTISAFNEIPPPLGISYSVENFPFRYCLLTGVSGHLLKSASINEASNQFAYSADGITVQDKDKAEIFSKLGGDFWNSFLEITKGIKVSQNISQAYGDIGSEYSWRVR